MAGAARRRRLREQHRRSRQERALSTIPTPDPCSCMEWCPTCDRRCMGGHANYPTRHVCLGDDFHQWST